MTQKVPTIFSLDRKRIRRARAEALFNAGRSDIFLLDHMADDLHERLAFMRHEGGAVLLDGFGAVSFAEGPWQYGATFTDLGENDLDTPPSVQAGSFDLVASLNTLDKVNDLPGALIQMRELLKPGGIAMASFVGGMSLSKLRLAMFETSPDKPAARIHPMIDPRSCPGLLSRAGWRNPVVDSYTLTVRYSSFENLLADLRGQALGNVLATRSPALGKAAYARARSAFMEQADEDGKVSETFEIITLTGAR